MWIKRQMLRIFYDKLNKKKGKLIKYPLINYFGLTVFIREEIILQWIRTGYMWHKNNKNTYLYIYIFIICIQNFYFGSMQICGMIEEEIWESRQSFLRKNFSYFAFRRNLRDIPINYN